MNLAEKIKLLRIEKNLTQEQLAEELKVSRSTISSWETNRSYPDLEMIIEICDYFDSSLDYLLRKDKKIVKKLNFKTKTKRIMMIIIILLIIIAGNSIISYQNHLVEPTSVRINNISVVRDKNYHGGDPMRDWNTEIKMDLYLSNPFYKIVPDNFLLREEDGVIDVEMQYSFSLFNVFNRNTVLTQSVLLDKDIKTKDIVIRMKDSDKELPFEYKNVALDKDSYQDND